MTDDRPALEGSDDLLNKVKKTEKNDDKLPIITAMSLLLANGFLITVGAICYSLQMSLSIIIVVQIMSLLIVVVLLNDQLINSAKIINDYVMSLIKPTPTVQN